MEQIDRSHYTKFKFYTHNSVSFTALHINKYVFVATINNHHGLRSSPIIVKLNFILFWGKLNLILEN